MGMLLAPFYSFFSKPFYDQKSRESAKGGFLYLLLLSLVMSVVVLIMLATAVFPQADRFMTWVGKEMPTLTIGADGVSMDRKSPYTMVHPELGPLATFDLDKEEITQDQMGDISVYVTKKNVYLKQPNQLRVYPLTGAEGQKVQQGPSQINSEVVAKFYATLKPIAMVTAFFAVLISFYVWKIIVALFYSLLGMLFNNMRAEKIGYSQLLNVTIFAMTPGIVFQMLRAVVPFLAGIPFLFVLDLSITSVYLYYSIKMSEGGFMSGLSSNA